MGRTRTSLLKRLCFGVLSIVALSSAALWLYGERLVSYLKPTVEQLASEATGLGITFDSGYVRLLPSLAIILHNGRVTPPNGCSPWSVERAALHVRLLPLFRRRLNVHSVELAGVQGSFGMREGSPSLTTETGEPCHLDAQSTPSGTIAAAPRRSAPLADSMELDVDAIHLADWSVSIFGLKEHHTFSITEAHASLTDSSQGLTIPRMTIDASLDEQPISLALDGATTRAHNTVFAAASGSLSLGTQRIETRGEYDLSSASGWVDLTARNLSFDEDERLFNDSLPPLKGEFTTSLHAAISGDDITLTGSAQLQRAKASLKAPIAAEELSAQEISILLKDGSFASASMEVTLRGFHCKDGNDAYSTGRAQGHLTVESSHETSFTADIDVENFGFKDEDTAISKASAKLNSIEGRIGTTGDVDVSVNLDAHSIYLTNPNIIVDSVISVKAPIEIKIPAGGGYSVRGPVSITGGVLTITGKKLEHTGGLIHMLVSSPLKDFRSTNLTTSAFGESISGRTHFAMTHTNYTLTDTSFTIGGGILSPELTLSRVDMHPFVLSAQAQNLPLVPTYRALMQQESAPLRGTLTTLSAKLSGTRKNLTESLSGEGSLLISNGVVQSVDIEGLVHSAIDAIPVVGPKLLVSPPPGQIQDGSISASVNIGSSKVSTQDLKVQFSNMTIEAALGVGFDSSLNGTAKVIFLEESFRLFGFGWDGLGNFLAREGRVAIPLVVGRTVSNPSVDPDMKEIGKFISGIDLVESVADGVRSIGGGR